VTSVLRTTGISGAEAEEVTTNALPGLAVSSDPNLPGVEGKIQSADDHPCNHEDGC